MNRKEFTDKKEYRTIHSMNVLLSTLIGEKEGPLHGKVHFPHQAPNENNIYEPSSKVYATSEKKILEVDEREIIDLQFPEQKYQGIHTFRIEGISYIAAGYTSGINIQNISTNREEQIPEQKSIIVDRPQLYSKFNHIIHTGTTIEDMVLWSAHSDLGIIKIPIKDLLQTRIKVVQHSSHYIYQLQEINSNNSNKNHIRLTTNHKEQIYASCNSQVYFFDQASNLFREHHSIPNEKISALAATESSIFTGTTSGKMYCNGRIYGDTKETTSKIIKIIPQNENYIFFSTQTAGLNGPLNMIHNSHQRYYPPTLIPIDDFQLRNNELFTLSEGKIKRFEINDDDTISPIIIYEPTVKTAKKMTIMG